MSSVPLIPGYQVYQQKKEKYPLLQTLEWKKGVPISSISPAAARVDEIELENMTRKELSLQFGGRRPTGSDARFLPKWAVYEKKVLQFSGFYTESLAKECDVFRVRQIILRYHLLDDTISIHEPKSYNSGLLQGLILKRQRVPRSNFGNEQFTLEKEGENSLNEEKFWHWSDLNRGITMSIYGRKYTLCDCDPFTKEFLLSEGTELKPPVEIPPDPYETLRFSRRETPSRISDLRPKSSRSGDRRYFGDLILKFDAMVEEVLEGNRCKAIAAVLSYRMADDKIEIRKAVPYEEAEIKRFSPVILRWSKVPLQHVTRTSIADVGEEEEFSSRHLTAAHLAPPATLSIFGRKVLVTGCDSTAADILEKYYSIVGVPVHYKSEEKKPEERISKGRISTDIVLRNKPSQGILGNEDSKILRFSAKFGGKDEVDANNRTCIISFHTSDSTFEIYEKMQPGGFGGRIMSRSRITKPDLSSQSESENQNQIPRCDYYTLQDLDIGKTITARGRDFTITGADRYVKTYAESDPQIMSSNFLMNLRNHFREEEYQEEIDPKTERPRLKPEEGI